METLISDLPDAGQHPNRTIAFGPDGMLYISVGSTCNACDEPNPEHATLLQAQPNGSNRSIYAKGLRNTIGFAWHPQTRELWGLDHGSDWRGNDLLPEELNRIVKGGNYGWPFCWGDKRPDVYLSAEPEGANKKEYCAKTQPPVLTYTTVRL
ncbi:PQQ-dependent sugar dehydrogenase [Nostoc sp. CHAB 5834]|nr:PQQ-dependent sugar dehydrogenase [Nostoc sp. CHAB 5834]